MKVISSSKFLKAVKKLKDKKLKEKIDRVLVNLEAAESLIEIAELELLKGHEGFYRIKFDYNYRIGIYYNGHEVELLALASREGFYKQFP